MKFLPSVEKSKAPFNFLVILNSKGSSLKDRTNTADFKGKVKLAKGSVGMILF